MYTFIYRYMFIYMYFFSFFLSYYCMSFVIKQYHYIHLRRLEACTPLQRAYESSQCREQQRCRKRPTTVSLRCDN